MDPEIESKQDDMFLTKLPNILNSKLKEISISEKMVWLKNLTDDVSSENGFINKLRLCLITALKSSIDASPVSHSVDYTIVLLPLSCKNIRWWTNGCSTHRIRQFYNLEVFNITGEKEIESPYLWMNYTIKDHAACIVKRVEKMINLIINHYRHLWNCSSDSSTANEFSVKRGAGNEVDDLVFFGRIERETESSLTENSTLFQEFRNGGIENAKQLWLNDVRKAFLFPGQIIAVRGSVSGEFGNRILATEIYHGIPPPVPCIPSNLLEETLNQYRNECIHLSIIKGPYGINGFSNGFHIIDKIADIWFSTKPHIVIVMGPFIDGTLPLDNNFDHPDVDDVYYTFFRTLNEVAKVLEDTKFVIIPSTLDIGHIFPVAQPPIFKYINSLFKSHGDLNIMKNIVFASNPVNLKLNDLRLHVTSENVFSHLKRNFVCSGAGSLNVLQKLCSAVLEQRTLFPSYTSFINPNIYETLTFLEPETLPHIFISTNTLSKSNETSSEVIPTFAKIERSRLFLLCGESANEGLINVYIDGPKEIGKTSDSENHMTPNGVDDRVQIEIARLTDLKTEKLSI